MAERALVLIKPEGLQRALTGRIITKFEEVGLKVTAMKLVRVTSELAGNHYADDKQWMVALGTKTKATNLEKGIKMSETPIQIGERIRAALIKHLAGKPVIALVLEGNAANDIGRKIAGATEPRKADPSTIRGMFSPDTYPAADAAKRPILNLVHVSENKEAAEREIKIWFSEKEIVSYRRADEAFLY